MDVAQRWTGREAAALRHAHRMGIRAYAAHLGIAVATVANWDGRVRVTAVSRSVILVGGLVSVSCGRAGCASCCW
jgi:DNA-binding transcriptional regulator YiaG